MYLEKEHSSVKGQQGQRPRGGAGLGCLRNIKGISGTGGKRVRGGREDAFGEVRGEVIWDIVGPRKDADFAPSEMALSKGVKGSGSLWLLS